MRKVSRVFFINMLELKNFLVNIFKKYKDAVAKWSNAAVCKTAIRGFDSRLHLQMSQSDIAGEFELLQIRRESMDGAMF